MSNPNRQRSIVLARILGSLHLAWGLLLLYSLIAVWPAAQEQGSMGETFHFLRWRVTMNPGQRMLAIVLLSGMAGSFVHGANSFVAYAGNLRLRWEWKWYYLLRPFFGAILALGFYLVVRGGLLTVDGGSDSLNVFGIAAISFLVGMNNDQAIKKLIEVFGTMFRTQDPDERGGKLIPAWSIESIEPATVRVGSTPDISITGSGFSANTLLLIGGKSRAVTFVNVTQLKTTLTSVDTAAVGKLELVVVNPPPQAQISEPFAITVE